MVCMRIWVPLTAVAAVSLGVLGAVAWPQPETTSPQAPVLSAPARCVAGPLSEEAACFSGLVVSTYHNDGLEAAATMMDDLASSPVTASRFASRCHDVAHALGESIEINRETDLESRGPRVCRSGFFHGVHFQRFNTYDTSAELAAAAASVCAGSENVIRVGSGGVGNGCRHALGHEFILRGYDPSLAASACLQPADATHNPDSAIEDCLHGVYMQVFLGFEAQEITGDPSDVCAPARSVAHEALLACLGEAGPSLFRIGADGSSPIDPFTLCVQLAAGERDLGSSCASGLGRAAAAYLENSRSEITGYCRPGSSLYEPCLVGAATAVAEAEQDHSWVEVCYGLVMEQECLFRMNDIMILVGTRS